MESTPRPYVLKPGEGQAMWGADGASTLFKATGELTGDRLAIIEDKAPRGDGTPLHAHADDDESFYVLEGELSIAIGNDPPVAAPAGTFVHIPGGVPHAFRVTSETARYLIVTTPHHGRFYEAMSTPATPTEMPEPGPMDMEKIEAACEAYGVEILGPPPFA
jgi:quercetin dioxygenase-like cupin family protein